MTKNSLNSSVPNEPFYTTKNHQKTVRGKRKGTLGTNGLINLMDTIYFTNHQKWQPVDFVKNNPDIT